MSKIKDKTLLSKIIYIFTVFIALLKVIFSDIILIARIRFPPGKSLAEIYELY